MTDQELQLRLLYAVIVAGKSAKFAEQAMAKLFAGLGDELPFHRIQVWFCNGYLDHRLRMAKVGNYGKVFKAFHQIAFAGLDLRTCSPTQLEAIHGIGPKTARFFIIWTRMDARVAALDVHVLRWLRQQGHDAPRQTPQGRRYAELEAIFLVEADRRGLTPHQLDAMIWSAGSRYDQATSFNMVSDLVGADNGNRDRTEIPGEQGMDGCGSQGDRGDHPRVPADAERCDSQGADH